MNGIAEKNGGAFEHLPTSRLTKASQDGWGLVASAVAASSVQPVAALHLGSFGFETPEFVREAAKRALDRPECNQYSPSNGRKALRDALAKTYSPFLGRELNAETELVVTTGANEGILSAITAFVNPGDEVLMFEPFYDQFPNNVTLVDGITKFVPLVLSASPESNHSSSEDWTFDMQDLEQARSSRTKMIILNSPNNPTGKVFSRAELEAIGNFCVKHNIIILSDEVYEHLSYVPYTRMASISPDIAHITLTAGSAGKSFFLTGWRVGWIIGPKDLLKHVTRAHTAICFSTVSPFQEAVAEALATHDCAAFWKQSNHEMYQRMQKFNAIWDELDFKYYEAQGGYFVVVDMSKLRIPEKFAPPEQFIDLPRDCHIAWFLTTVIGVAAIPCSTFTRPGFKGLPQGAIRFSFGKTFTDLDIAMDRLRALRNYV